MQRTCHRVPVTPNRRLLIEAKLAVFATFALLLAFSSVAATAATPSDPQASEATAYRDFLDGAYDLSIPPDAIDDAGFAVLYFPGVSSRGVALELDLRQAGAGNYRLDLATLAPIVTPTLDGEGRAISKDELADLLATPDEDQNVFCRRTDGNGGAVAWAQVELVATDGYVSTVPVQISNDGLAHADQTVISNQCGAGVATAQPLPFANALAFEASAEEEEELVWCISWFSSMCFDKGPGMRRCDGEACDVTMAALLDAAKAAGVSIPDWMGVKEATEWLSRKLGLSIGGYCGEVYFLGWFSVGCQCIFHTF